MQVVYERCCGLDVHKKVVVACLILLTANGKRHKEIRTFGTMTRDLLALGDWLRAAGCTHVGSVRIQRKACHDDHLWDMLRTITDLIRSNS